MHPFHYQNGQLYVDDCPLSEIVARYGTPCYVYSELHLRERYHAFAHALGVQTLTCYAVKANSNLHLLRLLAQWGAGFDIVSGGELARVLRAGGDPQKIVFSGVGKSREEIRAALEAGIFCLNVESAAELERIAEVAAEMGQRAPVALRVNPDVDPGTHQYIATGLKESKFGIPITAAEALYLRAGDWPSIHFLGVAAHIGSQLIDLQPLAAAARRLRDLYERLRSQGIELAHIDLGGGVGIRYHDEVPPSPADYAAVLDAALAGLDVRRVVELGRALVGNAGALLSTVEYWKENEGKQFCVVDAAMNDLLRPSLYGAWHEILPLRQSNAPLRECDVVGPVCESGDFFAKSRSLPAVPAGESLAILGAGAYGFAMSSQYNSRPRAPEVLVNGAETRCIRRRETLADLLGPEQDCLLG
ncbi:diaminopimelate decarboxylase [Acidithiobacillus sp. AMEEHan]|uniref:diaminopimelate decarboxylase n=1 Tax=Acidithiobacillus sp. AMEEHan TaxID=2994951 RepID=UPI0027E40E18|nr:diaminopimelate decarboxylase [Acidithiobacillus sp. AMEEHan]